MLNKLNLALQIGIIFHVYKNGNKNHLQTGNVGDTCAITVKCHPVPLEAAEVTSGASSVSGVGQSLTLVILWRGAVPTLPRPLPLPSPVTAKYPYRPVETTSLYTEVEVQASMKLFKMLTFRRMFLHLQKQTNFIP